MSKNKYRYYFPENKEFKKGLYSSDYAVIAANTGYKVGTVEKILNGHRKMSDSMKQECERIAHLNEIKFKK